MFDERMIDVLLGNEAENKEWMKVHNRLHELEAICMDNQIDFSKYLRAIFTEAILSSTSSNVDMVRKLKRKYHIHKE